MLCEADAPGKPVRHAFSTLVNALLLSMLYAHKIRDAKESNQMGSEPMSRVAGEKDKPVSHISCSDSVDMETPKWNCSCWRTEELKGGLSITLLHLP